MTIETYLWRNVLCVRLSLFVICLHKQIVCFLFFLLIKPCGDKTINRNVATSGYSSFTDSQFVFGSQFWPENSQGTSQDMSLSSMTSQQSSEVRFISFVLYVVLGECYGCMFSVLLVLNKPHWFNDIITWV